MTKYLITSFDFNDVFGSEEIELDNYDDAVKYIYDQIKPQFHDQIEAIGGDPESFVIFYPVTDEQGNEVKQDDPRYDELSDQQESRIELGYTIEELEQ